jgi:hypothetical protein
MRRTMRTAGAVVAASVLLVGLGACGDDDDDGAEAAGNGDTELAGGDGGATAGFCDAAVAVDQASLALESGETTPEEVDAAMQEGLDLAPEEVAADVEVLVTESREMAAQPETEDGPPPIPSDQFFTSSAALGDWLVPNCDMEELSVTAHEYSFEGFPETAPAGTTVLSFTNDGSEFHEVALVRIDDGEERSVEELLALPEEEGEALITEKGFVFTPPGASAYTTAELDPGRYAAVCFVPVGASPEALASGAAIDDSDPHAMHGMIAEFEVA